jgi:hypothetical protein
MFLGWGLPWPSHQEVAHETQGSPRLTRPHSRVPGVSVMLVRATRGLEKRAPTAFLLSHLTQQSPSCWAVPSHHSLSTLLSASGLLTPIPAVPQGSRQGPNGSAPELTFPCKVQGTAMAHVFPYGIPWTHPILDSLDLPTVLAWSIPES